MNWNRRYRVASWATGHMGEWALREVIRHPFLDLVGVLTYDEAKEGRDAGDLCGEGPTGVIATRDRAAIAALKADCVIYTPYAGGPVHTRAGSSIEQVVDDVVALLEAGSNVVTTCTDFHGSGNPRLGDGLERIRAAGERTGASLWASGGDPGLVLEQITFGLLATQRRVDSIEIIEMGGNLGQRPSPEMVFDLMGFGKPIKDFPKNAFASHLQNEYANPLRELAEAAGFTPDKCLCWGDIAAAKKDLVIACGEIKAGTVAAQRFVFAIYEGDREVVRLDQYAYVTKDVEPAWDLRNTGWQVRINGDAPFDADLTWAVPPDKVGEFVPAYEANILVNVVPYICAAPPGIITSEDMPPILPGGPRKIRQPRGKLSYIGLRD